MNNIFILIFILIIIVILFLLKNNNYNLSQTNYNNSNSAVNNNKKNILKEEFTSNRKLNVKAIKILKYMQDDFKKFFKTKTQLSPLTVNFLKELYDNRNISLDNYRLYEIINTFVNKLNDVVYINYFINVFDTDTYEFPEPVFNDKLLNVPGPSIDIDDPCDIEDKCLNGQAPGCLEPTPSPSNSGKREPFTNYMEQKEKLKSLREKFNSDDLDNFNEELLKMKNYYDNQEESNIESFVNINKNTLHKHTDKGQIKFRDDFSFSDKEWLEDPKNLELVSDYKFIPDGVKQNILNSTVKMELDLEKGNKYLEDLFKKYDKMIMSGDNQLFTDLRTKLKTQGYDDYEKKYIEELEKDKLQDKKMKDINLKIKELEESQNKINNFNENTFNQVTSLNDGQGLSIINNKDNIYKIKVNDGCLSYNKNKLELKDCESNNKDLLFNLNQIKNNDEFNNNLSNKLKEQEGIYYPFHLLNPVNNNNKCVNMNKLKVSIDDCLNKDDYKWRGLKTEKRCLKYN